MLCINNAVHPFITGNIFGLVEETNKNIMKSKTKAMIVIGTIVAAGVVSALLWGPQEKKALKKLKRKAKKFKGEWAAKTHKMKEKVQHAAEEAMDY